VRWSLAHVRFSSSVAEPASSSTIASFASYYTFALAFWACFIVCIANWQNKDGDDEASDEKGNY
jgi:hypothetical protein